MAVALTPVLLAWFHSLATRDVAVSPPASWYVGATAASVLSALVLASYVPHTGRRIDTGCTPCAVMAFVSVVCASITTANYGIDPAGPVLAVAFTLLGLTQRVKQPATCASR